jgi:hypothetical protein
MPLERVWSECGSVFINRKLDTVELRTISELRDCPRVLDIYENKMEAEL